MTKIKSIRQKRPDKKFRIPSSVIQWGIVGVVAVVVIVLVVGALSRRPAEPAPIPMLSTAKADLLSVTRMLGDVTLDDETREILRQRLGARLDGPDSLFAQRRWYDALADLSKMLKGASRPESAAIRVYMAFCEYESDNLDRSLQSFRKSLAADSAPTGIAPLLWFYVGWMFQSRGYQDSAVAYYSRVRGLTEANEVAAEYEVTPGPIRLLRAEAANNAGAAYEALRDTSLAAAAYREALVLVLVDTATYPKQTKTIRENLARLTSSR